MQIQFNVNTNSDLREAAAPRVFELYHENSKLANHLGYGAQVESSYASDFERYISTRGFRQFGGQATPLPEAISSDESLQAILLRRRSQRELSGAIELCELGTLLGQALGCTAIVEDKTGLAHALRAWPSAGGLYPLDTYLIARRVVDLDEGMYHYNPITHCLELLPSRQVDSILSDAFFGQEFARTTAVAVLLVASFDRTIAKYGERGYRLVLLDAGHASQNLLLTAQQLCLGAVAVAGYCDDSLAADLEIDGVSEAVVHTVLIGKAA